MRRLSDFSTPCCFWRGLIRPSFPSAPSTFGATKATASPPVTASAVITALLILVLRIRDFTPASISPIYLAYPRMNKSPIGQLFILFLFHYPAQENGDPRARINRVAGADGAKGIASQPVCHSITATARV